MSAATERFVRLYEELRSEVNRRAGQPDSQRFEVDLAASRDRAVDRNRRVLTYIRDVRNALQHPQHSRPGHAMHVAEPFLAEVKELLKYLQNPPTANSVGVARKEIRTAGLSDELGELAGMMKRFGFSHLPILDARNVVIGVFNEAAVFDYLWADTETIVSRTMRVEDILHHCRLDASRTETFRFVSPRTSLDDLTDMFLSLASPFTRVGAVFVTASGKSTEPLQSMITPWDVLARARA